MITNEEIEYGADAYCGGKPGEIDYDRRPHFIAGIKWALEQIKPKPKKGSPFVIMVDGVKSVRLETGDLQIWLSGDKSLAVDVLRNRNSHNTTAVINSFLERRCGEKFNGDSHLFNAFKKFWEFYTPSQYQSKSISKEFKTDSFVDEQFGKG